MVRRKKQTLADFNRTWGIPPYKTLRYTGIRGVFWYYFSKWVRQRDFKRYGACISCGKPVESENELQAGHFIAANGCGPDLLFHPLNVNGEHPGCNKYDKHKLGYERRLDERHGMGTAQMLKDMYFKYQQGGTVKDHPKEWYEEQIVALPTYQLVEA